MSSWAHQTHIALSGPMTRIDQQGSMLGSRPTFPSSKIHLVASPVWWEAETNKALTEII